MQDIITIRTAVLELLREDPKRSFRIKDISKKLELPPESLDNLKTIVNRLKSHQIILSAGRGKYRYNPRSPLVEGRIKINAKGFGFILTGPESDDIFIGRRQMGGAIDGDFVQARLFKSGRFGNPRGKIIRILARKTKRLIGSVIEQRGEYFLDLQPVTPERGIKIDRQRSIKFSPGQEVVTKVVDWGGDQGVILVKVVEVIGETGDPRNDVKLICRRYDYPSEFPAAVVREARQTQIEAAEIEKRLDLRHLETFTIDPESASDFDDALSIQVTDSGYRLGVHIADVSHFVRPGSHLDKEAYNRANSVYFTGHTIHMLPKELSADLCSLKPDCDRLAMSALIDLNHDFKAVKLKAEPTVIHSRRRFTYSQVQAIIDGDSESPQAPAIRLLTKLTRRLRSERKGWGSIDFDIPEPIIKLNRHGVPHEIRPSERWESHRLVEECMLLANRLIAEKYPLGDKNISPFLYRIHPKPETKDVRHFLELLRSLKVYSGPIKSSLSSSEFRQILARTADSPYHALIENIALRSLTKAVYSTVNAVHFGLAFKHYTHFTSPIRRYADLVVHRIIKNKKDPGKVHLWPGEKLAKVAEWITEQEIKALEAEREYIKIKQLRWLAHQQDQEFTGLISGVLNFGFFVELQNSLVEGLVHVDTLGANDWTYNPEEYSLTSQQMDGKYQLGDEVQVRLVKVDMNRLQANFALTEDQRRQ